MNKLPKIPLIFGVTGHRDLRPEDREKHIKAIKNIFTKTGNVCIASKVIIFEICGRFTCRETWSHLRQQKHLSNSYMHKVWIQYKNKEYKRYEQTT